ncbi:hypothetical protein ABK040_010140 [Willaertia magna]
MYKSSKERNYRTQPSSSSEKKKNNNNVSKVVEQPLSNNNRSFSSSNNSYSNPSPNSNNMNKRKLNISDNNITTSIRTVVKKQELKRVKFDESESNKKNEEEILMEKIKLEEQLLLANDEQEVNKRREERKKRLKELAEKEKQLISSEQLTQQQEEVDTTIKQDEEIKQEIKEEEKLVSNERNNFLKQLEMERNKILEEKETLKLEIKEEKEQQLEQIEQHIGGLKSESPLIDMFSDSPILINQHDNNLNEKNNIGNKIAIDLFDDKDGYYRYTIGEMINDNYRVISCLGQGVFSTVLKCFDTKNRKEVAIKVIRNNESMRKAGLKEIDLLNKLEEKDPKDEFHCVRKFDHFMYRNHLCIIFELLDLNLREILKTYGKEQGKPVGISMDGVILYTRQLLVALKHLQNCEILHADIKPDNMLVHPSHMKVKLSDFGSGSYVNENTITCYLVSRFYRAPEIILGMKYSYPIDMWSVACTIYELYTGKILFPSQNNNDALRLMMELKGNIPKKMLKKSTLKDFHFDKDGGFLFREIDQFTNKVVIKKLFFHKNIRDLRALLLNAMTKDTPEERKRVAKLHDFLEKALTLDPSKRLTVDQALSHPLLLEQ